MSQFYLTNLKSKINTGLDICRQFGLRTFCLKILPWLFRRRYFFYSRLIHPVTAVSPCPYPVILKPAKEEDLVHLVALRRGAYRLPQLKRRLRDGHLCFIGWIGHRPVQVRWIFTRSLYVPYLRRTLLLSPSEAYVDEAFTVPELRGQGIGAYTRYLLLLALLELGYKKYSCAVASWNKAQQRLAEKFGMEKVGEGGYVNFILGKKFTWRGKVKDFGDGRIEIRTSD